jgi:hypothetical protein
MKRAMWVTCCAVFALSIVSPSGLAQQAQDPFGPGPNTVAQAHQSPASETSAPAASGTADFCRCVGESEAGAVAKIKQALGKPLTNEGLEFSDTPLEEVAVRLQDEYRIPVQFDTKALEEAGMDVTEPVSARLHGISLNAALRLMLGQLQLVYVIENEVLMITTPEEAETQLDVCVYDVRGIVNRGDDQSIRQLVDTIVSCVASNTWRDNGGGVAEIRPLNSGLLVVSQTRQVHEEIRALLSTIRDMREQSPAKAEAAAKSAATIPESGQVITRAYVLQLSDAKNPEALRQQVRSLITGSLPDERWQGQLDDGQHVLLTVLPDRIVLRHTPAIQKEVEQLLTDSGVASAAPRIETASTYEGMEGGGYGGYGGGYGRGGYGGYGAGARSGYGGYGGRGFGGEGIGVGADFGAEEVPQPEPVDSE